MYIDEKVIFFLDLRFNRLRENRYISNSLLPQILLNYKFYYAYRVNVENSAIIIALGKDAKKRISQLLTRSI